MERTRPAAWLLLLVMVVALLVLALDPPGWRAKGSAADLRPARSAASTGPAPRPAAEREALVESLAAAAPAAAETTRSAMQPAPQEVLAILRVLDATDRAVHGARVLLTRGEKVLLDGATDPAGELGHAADSGAATLVVSVESRPPEAFAVRLDPGRQDVRLAETRGLDGRIMLESGEAAGGLRLHLRSDHPFRTAENIPDVAWDALELEPRRRTWLATKTDEQGRFVFAGLGAEWSGVVTLPSGWSVDSTSDGQVEPGAAGIRLRQPVSGWIVRIAPSRSLRGRLVLASDGQPLARATLTFRIGALGGSAREGGSATTDEDGRFVLQVRHEEIDSLELRMGADLQASAVLLRLEGRAIPPGGDLGDVVVEAVRDVPFVALDPERAPIRGAVASVDGVRSASTGADGHSTLSWIPASADRMRVVAEGFVPALVELPPVIVEPVEVVLSRTNRLEVRLLLPPGGDPEQFRVVLRREEGVTAAPVSGKREQSDHVGLWAFPPSDLMQAPEHTYLAAQLHSGMAVFCAVQAGVALELQVRPITGAPFHVENLEPLGPAEVRRVEIDLREELLVFRGRVLDLGGTPLVSAMLQLHGQILGWTDDRGEFLCFVLPDQDPKTLLIQHQACATAYLRDYVVPPGGIPQEFRLAPARRLTIEVVDEAGAPVPQAEVWILRGGFTSNTHRLEGHRHVADSLADDPFQIQVRLAGRRYTRDFSSFVPEARIVVPVHGSVLALVDPAWLAGRAGTFTVLLVPSEQDSPDADILLARGAAAPGLRISLAMVHPGTYRASLRYEPTAAEQALGMQQESSTGLSVAVEAGRETTIRLSLEAGG